MEQSGHCSSNREEVLVAAEEKNEVLNADVETANEDDAVRFLPTKLFKSNRMHLPRKITSSGPLHSALPYCNTRRRKRMTRRRKTRRRRPVAR